MSPSIRLWNISPKRREWYRHEFINGHVRHDSLPGVKCEVCGNTWGSLQTLPIECPDAVAEWIRRICPNRHPISTHEYAELKRLFLSDSSVSEMATEILPGDSFQPGYWSVPSQPRFDIFWPSVKPPIISERIKRKLENLQVTGIVIAHLVVTKIGKLEPEGEMPIPDEGEFDDEFFVKHGVLDDVSTCGKFFELVIAEKGTLVSMLEEGVTVKSCCPNCGYDSVEESIEHRKMIAGHRKRWTLPKRFVRDSDIFATYVFDGFLVNEKALSAFSENIEDNCVVHAVEIVD